MPVKMDILIFPIVKNVQRNFSVHQIVKLVIVILRDQRIIVVIPFPDNVIANPELLAGLVTSLSQDSMIFLIPKVM